jgi:hypothetical protein
MDLPRLLLLDGVPADLPDRLLSRDAALWIGTVDAADNSTYRTVSTLADLPWSMVLVESAAAATATAVCAVEDRRFEHYRGHKIPIAGSAKELSFPARSVPLYFLNGREDATDPEQRPEGLGARNRRFRRDVMIDELVRSSARVLVIAPAAADSVSTLLDGVFEELRPHVVALSPTADQEADLRSWSAQRPGPTSVTICRGDRASLVDTLADAIVRRLPTDRVLLRVRKPNDGAVVLLDCSDAIAVDSPLLEEFVVLQEKHLAPLPPTALTAQEIDGFFAKSTDDASDEYWRPYAAGLPWNRDDGDSETKLLSALSTVMQSSEPDVPVLTLDSEPGAGGTTTARALALAAARAGYPTLVARHAGPRPRAEHATTFMHSVGKATIQAWRPDASPASTAVDLEPTNRDGSEQVPTWLVVFDVDHWQGREEEFLRFIHTVRRFGHRAALLLVKEPGESLPPRVRASRLSSSPLSHELSEHDVSRLGAHINRFLEPLGRHQRIGDWVRFWRENSLLAEPGYMGASNHVASFWIALEFWLRGQLSLGDSIQRWLLREFLGARYRGDPLSGDARRAVLMIAAMSIERSLLPAQMLPEAPRESDPLSAQLEAVARSVPALGLVRRKTVTGHSWCIAHVPLARHMLDATGEDVDLLRSIGVTQPMGTTRLRLHLLEQVAQSPAMAKDQFRPLAVSFALNILKLDRAGHQEFAPYWRHVFNALFAMSDVVWNASRAFNHHVAISRRRVATDDVVYPDKSPEERMRLLHEAVEDLEYALSIQCNEGDEGDLTILNSLARSCQDLAKVIESEQPADRRIAKLRGRELECLDLAERISPSNSYVLETSARSLLARAEIEPASAGAHITNALQKIFVARRLDTADARRRSLDALTEHAYQSLEALPAAHLAELKSTRPALAAVVSAWILLRPEHTSGDGTLLGATRERVGQAIGQLESVAPSLRDWPLNRLHYELIALHEPFDFEGQLRALNALEGTPALTLQLRLERAILLYQTGSFERGKREYETVRHSLRDSDVIVDVPVRLAWLLKPRTTEQSVCDGRVVRAPAGWQKQAMEIAQMGRTVVVFNPLDFGHQSLPIGNQRKCIVGFNRRGPYAVPPHRGHG